MGLDIRFPIGLLFAVLGVLVTMYGLVSDTAIYQRSLDININLWWGLAMLFFGVLMLWAGWRNPGSRARDSAP
jgi:hypothetical protein